MPTAIKAGVMAAGVASSMYPSIVVREAWQVKRAHVSIWRISPERLPIAARSANLRDRGGYGQDKNSEVEIREHNSMAGAPTAAAATSATGKPVGRFR